jgi:hypothetical protein
MVQGKNPAEGTDVAFLWMQIASGVARGRLTPEEGVARLRELAQAHPADREWLQEEMETIRTQFGLDVTEAVRAGQGGYWGKLLAVIEALLSDRMEHARALDLLRSIDAQYPEHTERTTRLIADITDSGLRRFLNDED